MPEPSVSPIAIYQLRVVLRGVSPLIWRRLLVVSETSLGELHEILQSAFGRSGEQRKPDCWLVPAGNCRAPRDRQRLAQSATCGVPQIPVEIAEVRDRTSERGQAEPEEDQKRSRLARTSRSRFLFASGLIVTFSLCSALV